MTPKQQQELNRLRLRNKFLEQWNRKQRSEIRALERDKSTRKCPRLGANLVRWLVDEIGAVTNGQTRGGAIRFSKSDLKAARSLLVWIERLDRASTGEESKHG